MITTDTTVFTWTPVLPVHSSKPLLSLGWINWKAVKALFRLFARPILATKDNTGLWHLAFHCFYDTFPITHTMAMPCPDWSQTYSTLSGWVHELFMASWTCVLLFKKRGGSFLLDAVT